MKWEITVSVHHLLNTPGSLACFDKTPSSPMRLFHTDESYKIHLLSFRQGVGITSRSPLGSGLVQQYTPQRPTNLCFIIPIKSVNHDQVRVQTVNRFCAPQRSALIV